MSSMNEQIEICRLVSEEMVLIHHSFTEHFQHNPQDGQFSLMMFAEETAKWLVEQGWREPNQDILHNYDGHLSLRFQVVDLSLGVTIKQNWQDGYDWKFDYFPQKEPKLISIEIELED